MVQRLQAKEGTYGRQKRRLRHKLDPTCTASAAVNGLGWSGADAGQTGDRRPESGTLDLSAVYEAGLSSPQTLRMEIQMNEKTEWTRRIFAAALAGSAAIAQTPAAPQAAPPAGAAQAQIGRASCRERGEIS